MISGRPEGPAIQLRKSGVKTDSARHRVTPFVVDEPGLTVPHPRFRERRFVLEPLAALAPDLVDPVTGLRVAELLARVAKSD